MLANGEHALDAVRTCERTDLGMRFVRSGTEFGHLTEHDPLATLQLLQHFDAGMHGARVRVVRVVDEPGTLWRLLELQTALDRLDCTQSRDDVIELHASRCGGRGRAERVGNVVLAGEIELDGRAPKRTFECEAREEAFGADLGAHVQGREVGTGGQTEAHDFRFRQPAPHRGERVVRVDDGGARGCEPFHHLAFGARRAFDGPKPFEMLGAGVRDEADRRTRDLHERRQLAGMIGAHLDHRETMLRFQTKQRQRHADVIVEVAARGEAFTRFAENRRGHLLDRRLAVTSRDSDHRHRELCAPLG